MKSVNFDGRESSEAGKRAAFEAMTVELFSEEYEMIPSGSGGRDGGVECYKKVKKSWEGMQAKYFPRNKLTSGDKSKVSKSLKSAIKKWPPLKKYYICLPSDLLKDDYKWITEGIKTKMPEAKDVEIVFLGETKLENLLAKHSSIKEKYKHDFQTIGEIVGSIQNDVTNLKDALGTMGKRELRKTIEEVKDLATESGQPKKALEQLSLIEKIKKADLDTNEELMHDFLLAKTKALNEAGNSQLAAETAREIIDLFPEKIDAYIYLANIFLREENWKEFSKTIEKAKKIGQEHPSIKSAELLEKMNKGKLKDYIVEEDKFWGEAHSKERGVCYFIHALIANERNALEERDRFLEKAVELCPKRFAYKINRVAFQIMDLDKVADEKPELVGGRFNELLGSLEELEEAVKSHDSVEEKLTVFGNKLKLMGIVWSKGYGLIENDRVKKTIDTIFSLILDGPFTSTVDDILVGTLTCPFPNLFKVKQITAIIDHIRKTKKHISKELGFAFCLVGLLHEDCKESIQALLKEASMNELVNLITGVDSKDPQLVEDTMRVIQKMYPNIRIDRALPYIENVELRLELIKRLGSEDEDFKNAILLLTFHNKNDYDAAIELLDKIDIKHASFGTSELAEKIAERKHFWKTQELALQRLLSFEMPEEKTAFYLGRLSVCYFNLKEYAKALDIGIKAFANTDNLGDSNAQAVLKVLVGSSLKMGDTKGAHTLFEENKKIPRDFGMSLQEAEVLMIQGKREKALEVVVEGIKKVTNVERNHLLAAGMAILKMNQSKYIKDLEEISDEAPVADIDKFVKVSGIDRWFHLGGEPALDAENLAEHDARYKAIVGKKAGDHLEWSGLEFLSDKPERKIIRIAVVEDYLEIRAHEEMEKMAIEGSPFIIRVQVGTTPNEIKESLENVLGSFDKTLIEFEKGNFPLFSLISQYGGVATALTRMRMSEKGFILINTGKRDEIQQQAVYAKEAIKGSPTHLDGTSLFLLMQTGLFIKILSKIPKLNVPASVLEILSLAMAENEAAAGLRVGTDKKGLRVNDMNNDQLLENKKILKESYEFLVKSAEAVYGLPDNEKKDHPIEREILPEVVDACVMAKKKSQLLLTEDILYPIANEKHTGEKAPNYFSLWTLVIELKKDGTLTAEEYTQVIQILSSYRERFLVLNSSDILQSIFTEAGTGIVKVNPANIDRLNLNLLWSPKYDLKIEILLGTAVKVLCGAICDSSLTEDVLSKIFPRILGPLFNDRNVYILSSQLLVLCAKELNSRVITPPNAKERFNLLKTAVELYKSGGQILFSLTF